MAHGSWFMVHGSWFMVHGSWLMAHGSWFMDHGSWFMVKLKVCPANMLTVFDILPTLISLKIMR